MGDVGMSLLAIIPARGGSKRVPRKNLTKVGGKPLIGWSIEAARDSGCVDRIVVNTDSEEIAEVALALGAEVPFLRSAHLAEDSTPGIAPILSAMQRFASEGYNPDNLIVLQPTSPLRTTEDIQAACDLLKEKSASAVLGVTVPHGSPFWLQTIDEAGTLVPYLNPAMKAALPATRTPLYLINGAIYLVRTAALLESETLIPVNTVPYIMRAERSLDIDTPWDIYLADLILRDRASQT